MSSSPAAVEPAAQDGLPLHLRRWVVLTTTIAVVMASLDTAIANTALPTIAGDLHTDAATAVWIVNVYQLAMVATLLPFASLGETAGHERVYLGGLILFTFASLACALAWSLPSLMVARMLQGIGASGIMSVNAAIVRHIYPRSMLGLGVGRTALAVGVAFALGPTVASAILSVADWPWLFAVNVPFGLAAIAIGLRTTPRTPRADHRYDLVGGALVAAAFAALILAIGEAAHWAHPLAVGLELLIAVVLGAVLIRRQAGHPAPMLPLDLFRRPMFTLSAATAMCSFAAQGLAFVGLPFYFQDVLGRTAVDTGFLMTPWSIVVAVMAPVAGRLSDRYPVGILGGGGLIMLGIGLVLLATLPANPSVADIVWRMAVCGAGFGFFQSPNIRAIMSSAPPGRSGSASGMVATARLLGQTIGASLVALCFALAGQSGSTLALALGAGFAFLGSGASFLRLAAGRGVPAE
ncbi:MFS transporter [Azorhizobium doebereinerae]|uniref:MFS transporter n=1 Tax=Azorhizobium doebereinerae TaxID=281091 RepID=UPI00041C8BF9|nr:MFS transporter [Azorhizobium doebereinerae]